MRILVTGSRDWTDRDVIYKALEEARGDTPDDQMVLVHGKCPAGADEIAAHYAEYYDWGIEEHPAKWDEYGKAAGPKRNIEMADSRPDIVLAFLMPCMKPDCMRITPHDSHGTSQCANYAEAVGLDVRRFRLSA